VVFLNEAEILLCIEPWCINTENTYKRKIKVVRGSSLADFLWEHPEYEDEVEYID